MQHPRIDENCHPPKKSDSSGNSELSTKACGGTAAAVTHADPHTRINTDTHTHRRRGCGGLSVSVSKREQNKERQTWRRRSER